MDILTAHHEAALADNSFLAPSWTEIRAEIARSLGPATHAPGQAIAAEEDAQLRELDRKINELLPPEYQGRYDEVRPQSMGTAPLKFGPDGKVAWDEMWTSFCDLALAGGPPHRGTLLEAVPATDALAEPEKYEAVVAEIERGIRLVTDLPVVRSKTPGWVGVRCDSEEMAIWLMRAIIVENVMVRREGEVIYLPAGPQFTLKREIKNVVTVVAKTSHYWTAHILARRRMQHC
jgi:sirohydrochlorin cobaltochelatase